MPNTDRKTRKRKRDESKSSCAAPQHPKKQWRPWRPRCSSFEDDDSNTDDEHMRGDKKPKTRGKPVPFIYNDVTAKADIIPIFDPEKDDMESSQWINKIEQLAAIHNWPNKIKAYFMQSRLSGMAKVWHASLMNYELSWDEWKTQFLEAFPQKTDYVELLRDMLNRRKLLCENMVQYYYGKQAMLNRLEITGQKAVACIIDGLPSQMKAPARAGNYTTPSELYSKFLSVMTDFKPRQTQGHLSIVKTNEETTSTDMYQSSSARDTKKRIICFLCHEPGHSVRRCPKNTMNHKPSCSHCGKRGHLLERCWFKTQTNSAITSTDSKQKQ